MLTFLRGYAIAVLENVASESTSDVSPADGTVQGDVVARDLREVFEITSRTPALARVITDEVVPPNARRAVVTELLSARIVPPARRIVERAIVTERADGLLTVLNEIAELALHFVELGSEQFAAEEPLFGRVGARHIASGYATAVLEDVQTVAELEQIENELFGFARTVDSTDVLRSALADPSRSVSDRRDLISDLLHGRANPVTVRLARASMNSRSRDPGGSLDWMAERVAEARGWHVARVSSARDIDETERASLSRALEELTGSPVELLVTEDATLLGGAVITVGNLLVDASAQHRLDQLYEQMLGSEYVALGSN